MKKKIFAFFVLTLAVLTLASCGKKYKVEFDSDGGSIVAAQTVKAKKCATEPNAPTKDGFKFVEWQLDGIKYDFKTKVKKDITLKAVWLKQTVAGSNYKVSNVVISGNEEERKNILDEVGMASEEQLITMYKSTSFSIYFSDKENVIVSFVLGEERTSNALLYTISEDRLITFYETVVDKEKGIAYKDGLFGADFTVEADYNTVKMAMKYTETSAITLICTLYTGELEHEHTFASTWSSDDDYHWHAATCEHTDKVSKKAEHEWNEGVITTPATEEADGVKTYSCTVCNKTKTERIPALEHKHTFASTWSSDDDYHWHAATCEHTDETIEKASHEWDEGEITTAPDYGVEGVKTYTCTVCDKTKTESISALTPLFMPIMDRFSIPGRGVVVEGVISSGVINKGDVLTISGINKSITVIDITLKGSSKQLDQAVAGDIVDVLVNGVERDEIKQGCAIFTPSTKESYDQFTLNFTMYTKAEGGRHAPITGKTNFQFYLYPYEESGTTNYVTNVTGVMMLPIDVEMMMPGTTEEVTVVLQNKMVLEAGMKVLVKEGSRNVGYGTITSTTNHVHDASYDNIGKCFICNSEQSETLVLDTETQEYQYTDSFELNKRIYLKVTPNNPIDQEMEWRIEVYGATLDVDYEITVFDVNGNEVISHLNTGETYYIVISCMQDVNWVDIIILDSNAM